MSIFRRQSDKKKKEKSNAAPKGRGYVLQAPSIPGILKAQYAPDLNGAPALPLGVKPKSANTSLLLVQDEYYPGDLGVSLDPQEDYKKESKFCRSLNDIIHDHEAVPYLIQYMESCKASALIRFWLDSESFQASTWTRIRTHSLHSVSKSSLIKEKVSSTPSMTKSKSSISRDITSPDSVNSMDCITDESQSQLSDALPTVTVEWQPDFKHLSDNDHEKCAENDSSQVVAKQSTGSSKEIKTDQSESSKEIKVDQPENSKEIKIDQSGSSTEIITDQSDSTHTPGKSEQNYSESCDSRIRDKCKGENVMEKDSFSLPLSDCDSKAGLNSGADTNTGDSQSAISYRDIASPSPTGSCASSIAESSVKSGASFKSGALSTTNLADKLKKSVEQDAVRIFTKYLAQEATHPIGITDDLRNNTIRKICREDGQVDPECFIECQKFAVNKIQAQYFAGYKASAFQCKYQVELATGGKLHITDILYFESAFFYFMEYLEQEGLSHLLQFVIATDNFEDMLSRQDSYNGQEAQDDAMVLYDKYFSLQAQVPLGFPDSIRFEVESNICRDEGPLPDCFSKPRHIVLHTLEKRHFQNYLTSNIFYKYLSELVSALQTAQDFPLGQRKRRGSETSSEHSVGARSEGAHSLGSGSISSKNTLLAVGTSHPVQMSKLEENMNNFDVSDEALNPDKLWERPDSGKMSLGKIDTLGQFVSQFDPDPESTGTVKKKSSGGSRFFKSKKDKEKEQEEMARKVAEMILNDVTSVTQAISAIRNPGVASSSQS